MKKNRKAEKLLVIGNGFDLALNLKSSFSSFIKEKFQSSRLLVDNLHDSNLNNLFDSIYSNLNIKNNLISDDNKYNEILQKNSKIDFNFWIMYALTKENIVNKQDENWNDIENNIYEFLTNSSTYVDVNFFVNCLKIYFNPSNYNVDPSKDSFKDINIMFNNSRDKYYKFLGASKLILLALKYDANFKNICKNFYDGILDEKHFCIKLKQYVKSQLNNFELDFNRYMFDISQDTSYKVNSSKFLKLLSSGEKYKLLNFNYTTPKSNNQSFSNNIHGKTVSHLKINNSESSIIIGINGKDIAMNSIDYQFTKTFRITMMDYEEHSNIINGDINEIVFFGHSLSLADYSYFQTIFDYYDLINSKLRLIFYYSDHDSLNDYKLKSQLLVNISNLINLYAIDQKNNIGSGDKLLNMLVLNDRLKIRKIYIPK